RDHVGAAGRGRHGEHGGAGREPGRGGRSGHPDRGAPAADGRAGAFRDPGPARRPLAAVRDGLLHRCHDLDDFQPAGACASALQAAAVAAGPRLHAHGLDAGDDGHRVPAGEGPAAGARRLPRVLHARLLLRVAFRRDSRTDGSFQHRGRRRTGPGSALDRTGVRPPACRTHSRHRRLDRRPYRWQANMTGELGLYALILLLGTLPTYVWRFVGVLVAQRLDPDSEVLSWVRAVASALVSALVARIALVPPDLLNSTTLVDRGVALDRKSVV